MPILLVGESGVGKSFIAQLIFYYAKSQNIIDENSSFIIFNCAEYANNPELLSSALFGSIYFLIKVFLEELVNQINGETQM